MARLAALTGGGAEAEAEDDARLAAEAVVAVLVKGFIAVLPWRFLFGLVVLSMEEEVEEAMDVSSSFEGLFKIQPEGMGGCTYFVVKDA